MTSARTIGRALARHERVERRSAGGPRARLRHPARRRRSAAPAAAIGSSSPRPLACAPGERVSPRAVPRRSKPAAWARRDERQSARRALAEAFDVKLQTVRRPARAAVARATSTPRWRRLARPEPSAHRRRGPVEVVEDEQRRARVEGPREIREAVVVVRQLHHRLARDLPPEVVDERRERLVRAAAPIHDVRPRRRELVRDRRFSHAGDAHEERDADALEGTFESSELGVATHERRRR